MWRVQFRYQSTFAYSQYNFGLLMSLPSKQRSHVFFSTMFHFSQKFDFCTHHIISFHQTFSTIDLFRYLNPI